MPNHRPVYRPKTIEDVGLRRYLNNTADEHGGNGYDYIVPLFEADVNNANIAKLFKVDWRTVKKWKTIYLKEKGES